MLLRAHIKGHYDSVPNAPAVFGYGCVLTPEGLHVPVLSVREHSRKRTLRVELWEHPEQEKPKRVDLTWPQFKPGLYRGVTLAYAPENKRKTRSERI